MNLAKKILGFLLKIGFSVAIIWYLLYRSGASVDCFLRLSPGWLVLAILFLTGQYAMTAVRWFFLLRCLNIRLPFYEVFSLMWQGAFCTLFIPAGSVSGDLVKAGLLIARTEGDARYNGVFSILADRICGFAGLLITVLSVFPFYIPALRQFPQEVRVTVLIVAGACAAGLVCIFALFFYNIFLKVPLFKWIWDKLDQLTKGLFTKMADVINAYRRHWKTLLLWTLVSGYILFPLYSFSFWAIAKTAAPGTENVFASSLLGGLIGEVIGIIPATPGGIGTRDAAAAAVYHGYGIPPEVATVITTTFTVVMIVVCSFGAFFMIADSILRKKAK